MNKVKDGERNSRRMAFGAVAEEYDQIRPGYPEQLFADIFSFANLKPGAAVLEIGCGTGQATMPFINKGCNLTCIDLSQSLSDIARLKFANFPEVEIHTSSFESFKGEEKSYDMVFAATAMHWIEPGLRYRKAGRLLKPDGTIAVFSNTHPRPFRGFFDRVQVIYKEIVPEWGSPTLNKTSTDIINETIREIRGLQTFKEVTFRKFKWSKVYSKDEYLKLISTYSDHQNLGSVRLERLCSRIGEFIDRHYAGKIKRPYHSLLMLAKKVNF
ncbi:class I SAM-dependent methyltransferase [Candidatus Riflebacteria bacterium]